MVSVVACHARDRGSNPGGFSLQQNAYLPKVAFTFTAYGFFPVVFISFDGCAVAWWLTPPDPEVGNSSPTRVTVLCP